MALDRPDLPKPCTPYRWRRHPGEPHRGAFTCSCEEAARRSRQRPRQGGRKGSRTPLCIRPAAGRRSRVVPQRLSRPRACRHAHLPSDEVRSPASGRNHTQCSRSRSTRGCGLRQQLAGPDRTAPLRRSKGFAHAVVFDVNDAMAVTPGTVAARKLLVETALRYLDRLAQEGSSDTALREELAAAYIRVARVQGGAFLPNLGDTAGAVASFQKAIASMGPAPATPALARLRTEAHPQHRATRDPITPGQTRLRAGDRGGHRHNWPRSFRPRNAPPGRAVLSRHRDDRPPDGQRPRARARRVARRSNFASA